MDTGPEPNATACGNPQPGTENRQLTTGPCQPPTDYRLLTTGKHKLDAQVRSRRSGSGGGRMSDLAFAVQVFLERHLAPVLMLGRRLIVGYAYRRIPLTQGKFACVAPEDYPALSRHKWCAARQGNSWYAVRTEGPRQFRMHRVIMNAPPGLVVDHIDHDGLNNVPRNLRNCTQSQNARNQRAHRGGSSRFIGVCWLKRERKWWARIQKDNRQKSLGLFDDERAAAKARDAVALALHGEFANLNFPKRPRSWIRRILSGIRCSHTEA